MADAADAITMARFRSRDLLVDTKPDLTPVTEADRAAEAVMRDMVTFERPGHGVLGEEMGDSRGDGETRWILDPLDGTKNYLRGIPVWATLIALEDGGELTVGVVSAPALARRWWAARGEGAWADNRAIRVSAVDTVADAQMSYDSVPGFDASGLTVPFLKLARRCRRTRAFGDFWSHMLVAEGAFDIAVEPEVAYWDMAAVQVIVEEAGGRFTDLSGACRADGGSALATNGLLHDEVLAALVPPA